MAFNSQFALSLELTKILPLKAAADKAFEAVVNFERDLRVSRTHLEGNWSNSQQNTSSDIVVDADLTEFFGRCRIARNLESSFRTVVGASGSKVNLCEGLILDRSAGPTVIRGFQPGCERYFSTIIQCSLLTSISVY